MSYFEQFADFQPNPTSRLADEFARLALQKGWKKKSEPYKRQLNDCLMAEFNLHFDTTNKLESWQTMCREVRVTPGESITQCKKILKNDVHINIHHLIDQRRTGEQVRKFGSYWALRKWTLDHRKFFPLRQAKADQFLAILLKEF